MKRPKASRIRWLKARKGTREEEEEEEEKNQEIRNAMEREMAEKKTTTKWPPVSVWEPTTNSRRTTKNRIK